MTVSYTLVQTKLKLAMHFVVLVKGRVHRIFTNFGRGLTPVNCDKRLRSGVRIEMLAETKMIGEGDLRVLAPDKVCIMTCLVVMYTSSITLPELTNQH